MKRLVLLLLSLAGLITLLTGCGGGGGGNNGNFTVITDFISAQAARPVLGLIRINSDGSFSTEAYVKLSAGDNLRRNLSVPDYQSGTYIVIAFNDYDNDHRYDYNDQEELGVWDGYLVYENGKWAGYGLSDNVYLFSDVTTRDLYLYTDYTRSVKAMRSNLKPRELVDKALTKIKK